MAGTINKKSLQKIIFEDKNIQREILKIAQDVVEKEKKELINNFLQHPVTEEISGGENASNISGTLGGYGNLFSFIGFLDGFDPISPVLNLLHKISIDKKIIVKNNIYTINISIPSKEDLKNATKMPWESGRSWLWDIEKSISGIGYYLFGKFKQSRSGRGIQTEKNFSKRTFVRVSYFTPLYNNFLQKITKK